MKKLIFKKFASDWIKSFILSILSASIIIWVIQAVNFLDVVTEDGHGLKVYFLYTLMTLPKILSKILPFVFFISLISVISKYENNNELLIFWTNGINKLTLVNFVLLISTFFMLTQLILNVLIVPTTQDKARSFIRSSNLDFFEQIIKEKKFVDTVKDLTIFIEKKEEDGSLKNVLLKDDLNKNNFQIIIAKSGRFVIDSTKKVIVLYNGKILNKNQDKITEIDFVETEFNISKFTTKSVVDRKTQEVNSFDLVMCIYLSQNLDRSEINTLANVNKFDNCRLENFNNIRQEIYKRFAMPIYIFLLATIGILIVLKSKDEFKYTRYKILIFLYGMFIIIFGEMSQELINENLYNNILVALIPIVILIFNYIFISNNILKLE
jgi:lipopolysaccharide export system permease protein|tara:strand:+ start:479 stop:1618 length:1140 start_codon:yes stop_codon:yes gene_type:complete